ncbi:MAG TPA: tetratricopeptide repeat protein [Candidatus Kapabacteria bacterium]|nr:tetratricopeptide repeat protein [Candidatus Kapabacteria bacterium]
MTEDEFAQKYKVARVYEETRDLNNALRLYQDLYKIHPERRDVADGYVRTLYALKKFSDAEAILSERLSRESADAGDLYLLIGKVRAQLGKKTEALDAFTKAADTPGIYDQYISTTNAANAMVDVGYNEEALALLQSHRHNTQEADYYSDKIAELLFKINRYDEGTDEYLALVRANDQWLHQIESRLSAFTIDTNSRRSIIKTVISHIDTNKATVSELQLLGWCYGELKDYWDALDVELIVDRKSSNTATGIELVRFADRALAEGAYQAAARAYDEATARLRTNYPNSQILFAAGLGAIKAKQAYVMQQKPPSTNDLHNLVNSYTTFAAQTPGNDIAMPALIGAAEIELKQLHDPAKAKEIYEQVIARGHSASEPVVATYFSLEETSLEMANIPQARLYLDRLETLLRQHDRPSDAEPMRHIELERGRMDYFEGNFDTALTKLTIVAAISASDFANDAIALKSLIEENREGSSDAAMKVFAKADLLSLGSDIPAALSGFKSIRETFPKAAIADEATLRAADLMVKTNKPADAVALLEEMQEKMTDSPLLDRAAFREAEITERELSMKDKALKLYEDFLARYPKSSFCTEARQRARKLRGDVF